MNVFIKIWYNFLDAFVKFKDFKGRSNKYEFWSYITVDGLVKIALAFLVTVAVPFVFVAVIYAIMTIIPTIAAVTRRVHDAGRSGWWVLAAVSGLLTKIPALPEGILVLFSFIAIISVLYVLVLTLCPSDKDNKYGPTPACTKEEGLFGNLLIFVSLALPLTFATYSAKMNQMAAESLRQNINISEQVTPHATPQAEPLATSASAPQNSAQ
jgi:uncharacterized membrane protein YhaH (DUF805 family)